MGDVSIERLKVLAGRLKYQSPLKSPLFSNSIVSPLEPPANLSFPKYTCETLDISNQLSVKEYPPALDDEFFQDELQKLEQNLASEQKAEDSHAEQSELEEFELLESYTKRVCTKQHSPGIADHISNGIVSSIEENFPSVHSVPSAAVLRDSIIFGDKQHIQERLRQLESTLPEPNVSATSTSQPTISPSQYLGHSLSTIQEVNSTAISSIVRSPLSTVLQKFLFEECSIFLFY